MALYSPHCSFLPHHLSPDHSPSRHCAISQALHALLPPLLLQQHSSADLGVVARIQPFTLPGAQPAAFSSGSTSTEQGYGRDPSYGTALSDTESPDKASSPKAVETYSLSLGESQEPNLAAANTSRVLAADTARVPEEGELVAKFSKKAAMGSTSRSRRSFELKQTYLSDAREATATTVSQAREKEPSFDSKPAVLVRGDPADGFERLPINLDLDLYRARCLFRSREYKKAETILRQCVKDWPSDGRAYVFLGTRLMKQGKFVDARAVFEDGCQAARGENPFIWQAWAVLEQKLGHISEARKLFDAATAADIRHAAAWHGWAILELQQGSTRKARELLSKGLKYCGGNEYLYQTSALIEYRAGKVEEARALFSQAIQYNPKSCASWLAWALLESDKGNNSTARYLFQRGIRASPKNRYAWQAWALFESNQGNKDWARRLFQQGVELNPNDAVLLQAFALFEYDSSNPVMARELFDRAASVDPKHQPVWNARGWVEWKEGNLDMARQYYKKSLSINSRSVDAARTFHAWAVLEEGAGNYSAARELFKCTLRVDSQNVPAWTSWAKLEENVGNGIRAEEIRMQYLQQRTEVVDEAPWDVTFSSMLVPAFTRIKEFLRIDVQPTADEDEGTVFPPEIMEVLNKRRLDMDNVDCDTEFDIEAFIREVLPWKNKSESRNWKERPRFLNITNVPT